MPLPRTLSFLAGLMLVAPIWAAEPAVATPEALDHFWTQTRERLTREPLDAEVVPLKEPLPYRTYQVTLRSLGGVHFRALLAVPVQGEAPPRRWPAIVTVPGYGGTQQGVMLSECLRGYVILQVYPRGQGESAALWKPDGPDKLIWHVGQPEGAYYQGAYADVMRGIDYLATRADVDAQRIGLAGTSQGGGIALAVAGLDPRIKVVVAHVPFLCDMRQAACIPRSLVNHLLTQPGVETESALQTLDYFDPLNLAHSIQAPALVSAGGKDETCPVVTIRAVFDHIPAVKGYAYYPDLTHTSCAAFYIQSWAWLDWYLKN
ncbi:MAG: acetylxylan esterase [Verrucomicrobia bacterium]|nr:acetylxylan esterase [Verrucomicrobiota bacterium]